jgi:hypothetical protein
MSIQSVQKKRFLDTIYKMYYALGEAPSDNEISAIYSRYFSRFQAGNTIPVPYNDISYNQVIDPEKLNRVMVHTLFNVDVLYDVYHEQVEELYDIVNAYAVRLEDIRSKRVELEKKVDDQMFSLANTDGFYYSITNAFNNLDMVDLNYSDAHIDTSVRKATIPKLTSGLFDYVGNILNTASNTKVSLTFEGTEVKNEVVDFSNVFNGLNNLEWSYAHKSSSLGICTLKITVPVSSTSESVSLVEGKISSQKPVDIGIIVVDQVTRSNSASFMKSNSADYDRFSFHLTPQKTNAVELYLTKSEPDYTTTENGAVVYNYDFRIDELIISAPYYDASATMISAPMSLPSENNSKLAIDAVSISVDQHVPNGTEIRYYIAPDNASATSIYDFNWTSISQSAISDATSATVVNFNGSNFVQSSLVTSINNEIVSSSENMVKIPRSQTLNNPIPDYFYQNDSSVLGFNVYRSAKFPSGVKPYNSYILENVSSNQLKVSISSGSNIDKQTWQQILTGQKNDIVYTSYNSTIDNTQNFFTANNIPYGSIHLSTHLYAENDIQINDLFLKSLSAQYWDVKIYLNGNDVTSNSTLSPGVLSANMTWNIKKGQNDLIIIINKSTNDTSGTETTFNGTVSLLKDRSILSVDGIKAYRNYLYEVRIEDLRLYYSNSDNVFSIINYQNNYEIVYRRTEEIQTGTKVYYYSNIENQTKSIRLRADLLRGQSAFSAPAINSYTVKFKH